MAIQCEYRRPPRIFALCDYRCCADQYRRKVCHRRKPGVTDGYSYEWSLFTDWCVAGDIAPLPISPVTLAEFLDENPAGDSVQLRRVSAINRRHLDAGFTPPGLGTSIRVALDSARAARRTTHTEHYHAIAGALPHAGSTAGLFGRRDAVLLMLAGAGLSFTAIASLDRSDVVSKGHLVWVDGGHRVRIEPDDRIAFSPAVLWERWRAVLRFSDRYPSTTLTAEHLRGDTFPDMNKWPNRPGPVAVPINRWGHFPLPVTSMTAADIGAVIRDHRTGTPPQHALQPHATKPRVSDDTDPGAPPVLPHAQVTELDTGYYRSGVDARLRAHAKLAYIPNLVDEVEDRIEQLLQRTLKLLDGEDNRDQDLPCAPPRAQPDT